ncbi:LAGLIDADG family homing endonuclease [Patescibacteria group bacterium]|nr:LAGLIDADG family homing endonuclease [Patescibacteria group bacterium]
MDFTSKDKDLVALFRKCLKLDTKISSKLSGEGNVSYHTQFGDVLFYGFLTQIGLTPAKSKTISRVAIPDGFFVDFLRGYFDGDGSSYSYADSVFKKSYRFYISFTSASPKFIEWLREELNKALNVKGYLSHNRNNAYVQLKYAKKESVLIAKAMYYDARIPYLKRKRLKILESLRVIESKRASGEIGRRATFRS